MAFRLGKKGTKAKSTAPTISGTDENVAIVNGKAFNVPVGKRKKTKLNRKALLLVGASILLVVSGGSVVYWYKTKNAGKGACSADLLERAKPYINPYSVDNDKLLPIVEEIEALENYDKDPDCLYINLLYRVNTSNASRSAELLNKLEQIYSETQQYDPIINETALKLEDFKSRVEFLKSHVNRNTYTGPDRDGNYE
jgi:hypothetical protein